MRLSLNVALPLAMMQRQQQQQQQEQLEAVCKVRVEYLGPKRGRGIVATQDIGEGEVIYTEAEPVAAAQHEFSRLCGLTCSKCLRFVGSLEDCISHVLRSARRSEALKALEEVSEGFAKKWGLGLNKAVPCGEEGCDAVFCSEECRRLAKEGSFHRVICEIAESRSPWRAFVTHARRHHDGLLLAGQCVAQVLFDIAFMGLDIEAAKSRFSVFHSAPWESLATGGEGRRKERYRALRRIAASPKETDEERQAERETEKETERQAEAQTDRETERQAERETDRQTDRESERQTEREKDKRIEREAKRKKERQTERETETETERETRTLVDIDRNKQKQARKDRDRERQTEAEAETETETETETVEGRHALLTTSLLLLRPAVTPFARAMWAKNSLGISVETVLRSVLDFDFYSRLMGTFSLVCLDVEFEHPTNRCLPLLFKHQRSQQQGETPEDEETKSLRALCWVLRKVGEVSGCTGAEDAGVPFGAPEEENVFGSFLGWGLFAIGSLTNHSCWPNAEADFPLPRPSLEVRALRPIRRGEEVLVSYIDEHLPLHARQRILQKNYKFSCTCPRCLVEAAEALLVVTKSPECSDEAKLEELVARRTGLPLGVVSELRAQRKTLNPKL